MKDGACGGSDIELFAAQNAAPVERRFGQHISAYLCF